MAAVVDMRSPQHPALTWQVSADVECAAWDPHAPQYFVVSTEDGLVRCHDVRKGRTADGASSSGAAGEGALFTLAAHDKPTCSVSFNPAVPNVRDSKPKKHTLRIECVLLFRGGARSARGTRGRGWMLGLRGWMLGLRKHGCRYCVA